ncbi:Crp/Fnr family transcriptional regulator [Sutterella sp.]|uniref:Crp/Fnr family transcriptional regulator n=1 Tax=Sutterella sp. TaxID=1981025 RepID=UPI0026DEB49D|nr:hypothetical protein [Sutterella sp.]MDO5530427.1 hypothetical protein [Sutterella sp.]
MKSTSPFLPWFAPRLSRAMAGVLQSIGHRTVFMRGERIYESPGFFQKLMFVRRGIVAKALVDPFHEDPLFLSLSGPGALCGSYETLYLQDRMQRRHWCVTTTEVTMVNADLLLRICDQNPAWQRELSHYSSVCAVSDRLGMLVAHSTTLEERLGVLLIVCTHVGSPDFLDRLRDESVEWIALGALPSTRVAASILNATPESVREVLRRWAGSDLMRYRSHKILVHRTHFQACWERIAPILRTANSYEAAAQSSGRLPVRDMDIP